MYIVLIAWLYVTLMMAVAEANSATGTLLGAIMTFVLYGLLPMGIVGYIMATPSRKRAIKAREMAEQAAYEEAQARKLAEPQPAAPSPAPATVTAATPPAENSPAPDASGQPATAAEHSGVAPVRKEP
jgi:hypothetical protein